MQSSSSSENIQSLTFASSYKSCIKIAGIPILPPLITDEQKTLLADYKSQAIEKEQKLRRNRLQQQQLLNQQQDRLSNADLNTSSDSSGIFTKSIDSSNKENYRRYRPTLSRSQSELNDESTICDAIANFSSTDSSPDKTCVLESIKLSPSSEADGSDKLSTLKNDQSTNTTVIKNFKDSVHKMSPQTASGCDDVSSFEKFYSPSLMIEEQNDDDDNSTCLNSETSVSVNSVLEMLPESNKENNKYNDNSVSAERVKEENLNLSPCKDLVLKSNVFSAISRGNITLRKQNTGLHLSKEFFKYDDILQQNKHSIDFNEIDNEKKWLENETSDVKIKEGDKTDRNKYVNVKKSNETPPRLVRQNSYTLDSPSPELLAFVQRQKQIESEKKPGNLKRTRTWTVMSDEDKSKNVSTNFIPFQTQSEGFKKSRKFWNVEEAKQQWNKQKNDIQTRTGNVNDNNKKDENHNKLKQKSIKPDDKFSPDRNYKIPSKAKVQARSADCVYSLTTDFTQNLDDLSYDDVPVELGNRKYTSPVSIKSYQDESSDCNFRNLENQLDLGLNSNNRTNDDALSTMTLTPEKDTTCDNNRIIDVPYSMCSSMNSDFISMNPSFKSAMTINDDTASMCSSISLNKFMSVFYNNDKNLPTNDQTSALYSEIRLQHYKQIEDLLRKQDEELQTLIRSSRPSSAATTLSPKVVSNVDFQSHNLHNKNFTSPPTRLSSELASSRARSCIRQLNFSNKKHKKCPLEYTEEERKAAVIITAYAKGYLVRRLFKTERVQQIIKSITDSLQCASNFDYTNRSNWSQADVDLHERLIVQIEAASFTFSEIFNMAIVDKMAMIRADREKKRLPRPLPEKPVLSAATRRVMMRKKVQPQTISKSSLSIKPNSKQRLRRRSFTGFSNLAISSRTQQLPSPLQKSASVGCTNRQPWR